MANNNVIFNAAFAGASFGPANRWIIDPNSSAYTSQVQPLVVFANEVDALIPSDAGIQIAQGRLMQTICEAILNTRFPQSTNSADYTDIAAAVVAIYNAAAPELLSESSGSGSITPLQGVFVVAKAGGDVDGAFSGLQAFSTVTDAIQAAIDSTIEQVTLIVAPGNYASESAITIPSLYPGFDVEFLAYGNKDTTNVNLPEFILESEVTVSFNNCIIAKITPTTDCVITLIDSQLADSDFDSESENGCTYNGHNNVISATTLFASVDAGAGLIQFRDTVLNGANAQTIDLKNCTNLGTLLCASLTHRAATVSGDLTSTETDGAPHSNPPWNIQGLFTTNIDITVNMGGSLDIWVDESTFGSFYFNDCAKVGNVDFFQYGAAGATQVEASDDDNTVNTDATDAFTGITGSNFAQVSAGGNPTWDLTAAGCILTARTDYTGAGTPPPIPPMLYKVTIIASVITTTLPCWCGLAVSVDDDTTGAIGTTFGSGIGTANTPGNNGSTSLTACRYVMADPGVTTVRPKFATDGGEDIIIERLNMIVEPVVYPTAW